MNLISLNELENRAKKIKQNKNISFNQALQAASKEEGFLSFQAFLKKTETVYCKDENEYIKDFKSNIFKNRKHIKSNFNKLKNLKIVYDEIINDEKYDNDEKEREELLEKTLYKADNIAKNIADLIFPNQISNFGDNSFTSIEIPCFNIYTSSDYITAHNDYGGEKLDFSLQIILNSQSFELGFRNLENYKDVGFTIPKEHDPYNFTSITIKLP